MSDLAKVIPAVDDRSRWTRFPFYMMALWLGLVLVVISVAGCGPIPPWPNTVAEAILEAARTDPNPGAEGNLGAELYSKDCAGCHGRGAESLTAMAGMSEAEVFSFISEGDQQRGMPAYGNTLNRLEIEALVGYLKELTGPESTSDSAAEGTVLALQAEASHHGGTVTLIALLTDQAGNPIAGAPIDFVAQTLFGDLPLGSVTTGPDGIATLTFELAGARLDSYAASYAGHSKYGPSSADAQARLAPIEAPPRPSGSLITSDPPLLPTLIVITVVGSVWIVFAYVVYQLIAIRRGKRSQP